jgi:hypothetical protein
MNRGSFTQAPNFRFLFRVLLSIPPIVLLYGYLAGTLTYGAFIHASGDWPARLLLVALSATPLRMLLPGARSL